MTSPKSIACCPADETLTILDGARASMSGSRSRVSRKPAR